MTPLPKAIAQLIEDAAETAAIEHGYYPKIGLNESFYVIAFKSGADFGCSLIQAELEKARQRERVLVEALEIIHKTPPITDTEKQINNYVEKILQKHFQGD